MNKTKNQINNTKTTKKQTNNKPNVWHKQMAHALYIDRYFFLLLLNYHTVFIPYLSAFEFIYNEMEVS